MNGEGFAFFRWRVFFHHYVGDDADWWAFYRDLDMDMWRSIQGKPADEVKP